MSHCIDTGQEVDGCSCYINGSNITSVECSASGFPHPPVITWEEGTASYQSSSINLTRFRENTTLTCKAKDGNLKSAVENKIVCVYYERGMFDYCNSLSYRCMQMYKPNCMIELFDFKRILFVSNYPFQM